MPNSNAKKKKNTQMILSNTFQHPNISVAKFNFFFFMKSKKEPLKNKISDPQGH